MTDTCALVSRSQNLPYMRSGQPSCIGVTRDVTLPATWRMRQRACGRLNSKYSKLIRILLGYNLDIESKAPSRGNGNSY